MRLCDSMCQGILAWKHLGPLNQNCGSSDGNGAEACVPLVTTLISAEVLALIAEDKKNFKSAILSIRLLGEFHFDL